MITTPIATTMPHKIANTEGARTVLTALEATYDNLSMMTQVASRTWCYSQPRSTQAANLKTTIAALENATRQVAAAIHWLGATEFPPITPEVEPETQLNPDPFA
jgi:hypothetical protein